MRDAQRAGMPVSGRVIEINAGGLRVDLGSARGFCPLSQIEPGFTADPKIYLGRTLEFLGAFREGAEMTERALELQKRRDEHLAFVARLYGVQDHEARSVPLEGAAQAVKELWLTLP